VENGRKETNRNMMTYVLVIFGLNEMLGNSSIPEGLVVSQERLDSKELVNI
jgi:hypothetical protein